MTNYFVMWSMIACHVNICVPQDHRQFSFEANCYTWKFLFHENVRGVRYKYDVCPNLRFRCMEQMALFFLFGLWRSLFICANIPCTDPLTHQNWIWYILHIWHLVWNPIVISPDQTAKMYPFQIAKMYLSQISKMYLSQFAKMNLSQIAKMYLSQIAKMYLSQIAKMYLLPIENNVFVWGELIC